MIPLKKMGKKSAPGDESEEEGLLSHEQDGVQAVAEPRNSIEGMVDDVENMEWTDSMDPLDDNFPSRLGTKAYAQGIELQGIRKRFHRHARWIIAGLVLVICIWTILALGSFWVYKLAPVDGLSPPWYPTPLGGTIDTWSSSYAKAAAMVEKMSLVSKVNITSGTGWMMGLAVGNTGPANDVGFPGLALQDGPLGIRFADHATAFPAGLTVGATWNKELMYQRGQAHGMEARKKGINVLLGPAVGPLGRSSAGGRNWEGFGSDPYLQGVAASETIRGIQGEGVIATIKHFIGNEQEHFRQSREWLLPNALSSNIGDRTLHELYLWPFADAVKAGVGSVMCSYQMTNNSYSCGNSKLLNGILKDELGFQGFVQSDWLAQRGGVSSGLAGLDMTMPGDGYAWMDGESYWGPELTKAVLNGSFPMARLNDMVTRVVAAWYQLGQDDTSKFDGKGPNFSSWTNDKMGYINPGSLDDKELVQVNQYVDVQGSGDEAHSILARRVAAEGTVLVKNALDLLPLSRQGGVPMNEASGYNVGIFGEDAGDGGHEDPNSCPDRGCNIGTLGSGWGSGSVEFPYLVTPVAALQEAFDADSVRVNTFTTNKAPEAKILKAQDLCMVFVNSDGGEGYLSYDGIRGDRNDLNLQNGGDDLVMKVADSCGGKTIVVVHAVGPVIVDKWIDHSNIDAVILAHLPGQESGNALVDILFGNVNPSGKLPYTVPRREADGNAPVMYLPGSWKELNAPQQNFNEGIFIDYRHFDLQGISPRFEFGFGLSYTSFSYSDITIETLRPKSRLPDARPAPTLTPPKYDETLPDPSTALFPTNFRKLKKFIYPYLESLKDIKPGHYPYPEGYDQKQPLSPAGGGEGGNPSLWTGHVKITFKIKNAGKVAGYEVAQLYMSYPGSPAEGEMKGEWANDDFKYDNDMSMFPVKVLRGFEKVWLEVGEEKVVDMTLTRRDLSYWDTREQNWVMLEEGKYTFRVGRSSRDLDLEIAW